MQRLLLVLTVIQMLALGWLAAEMMGVHDEVQRLSSNPPVPLPTSRQPRPESPPATDAPARATVTMANDQSLDDIRLIVREELEYALAELDLGSGQKRHTTSALSEEESMDRLYETTLAIDAYAQQGAISEQDMNGLQQQIAKLNPKHRSKALQHLTRAMNSGQLNARF